MTNAGRSTRDLNLCHPASYTALTRTKLVPAKESEGTISLSLSPGTVGNTRCLMTCSLSKWQGFLPTGNQQQTLVFFLDKNYCDPPTARFGDHPLRSAIHFFHFKNLLRFFSTDPLRSFFHALLRQTFLSRTL